MNAGPSTRFISYSAAEEFNTIPPVPHLECHAADVALPDVSLVGPPLHLLDGPIFILPSGNAQRRSTLAMPVPGDA